MDLKGQDERNKLRHVVMRAQDEDVMSQSEAGFVVTLVERFRQEIEKKQRMLNTLQGELSQLRANEKVIVDLIENIIKAAERDKARQETMANIKGHRENSYDKEVNSSHINQEVDQTEDSTNEEDSTEK